MNEWVDAAASDSLTEGAQLALEIAGEYIMLVRYQGLLYAYEDRCTHDDAPLQGASLEDDDESPCGVVVCPRHGARFCLQSGEPLGPPAYEAIKIFAVRERNARIEICV
jgi:3-phenylpropionate/trans-cinnamate dioxygenase ferredoxin subunit